MLLIVLRVWDKRKTPKRGVLCLQLKFPISKSQREKLHVNGGPRRSTAWPTTFILNFSRIGGSEI
jgi:hypothetical protein